MQATENPGSEQRRWRCGEFVIDAQRRRLLRSGVPVDIEERTFDLIVLLAAQHRRAVDRREIMEALWGSRPVGDNTLRQVVYKARQALGDDGRRQGVIRTLHGRSLRWVALLENEPAATQADTARVAAGSGDIAAGRRQSSRRAAPLFALAIVLFAGLTILLLRAPPAAPDAQPQPAVVAIGPIANATGDDALDWTRSGLPALLAGLLDDEGIAAADWRSTPRTGTGEAGGDLQRAAAGATAIVVDGRLRKLDGSNYELDLRVQAPQRKAEEIRIAGDLPGRLAADAVPRLRRALARIGQPLLAAPQGVPAARPVATR